MRSTRALMLLSFFICSITFGNARDIYLRYDNSCLNRLEYAKPDNSRYFTYQLIKNSQERILLDVGSEAGNYNSYLPATTTSCTDLQLNEGFAREINNGTSRLFIVIPSSGGYNISQVKTADYFYNTEKEVGYSSHDDYVFVYNLNVRARGINLATPDSKAKVYFRGTQANSCPTRYYFRQVSKENYQPYTDLVIVPKIGILEKMSGLDATEASKNKMTLVKYNDIQINKYLEAVCNGYEDNLVASNSGTTPATTNTTGSTPTRNKLEELEAGNTTYYPNTTTAGNGSINPTSTTSGTTYFPGGTTPSICPIYKDVDRNLYIDRATGLPATTTCGGNSYRNGYKVADTTPVVTTTTQPTTTTTTYTPPTTTTYTPPIVETTPTNTTTRVNNCGMVSTEGTHIVLRDETLYSIARMYNVNVKDLKRWNSIRNIDLIKPCSRLKVAPDYVASKGSSTPVATSADGTHVVKRNETLYSIAKAYGFTASKFAEMNGINAGEVIYVGQRLKTKDCNCPAPNTTASTPTNYTYSAPVETLTDRGANVPTEYSTTNSRRVHIVKQNDTIYSIAKRYGTTVARIRSLNNLENSEIIIPFQKLYLD